MNPLFAEMVEMLDLQKAADVHVDVDVAVAAAVVVRMDATVVEIECWLLVSGLLYSTTLALHLLHPPHPRVSWTTHLHHSHDYYYD
jgi:hypothetical protein